jgi:hypothetical protein
MLSDERTQKEQMLVALKAVYSDYMEATRKDGKMLDALTRETVAKVIFAIQLAEGKI